jgi:hypothetical protein
MAQSNPTWGEERIANELLLKLRLTGVTAYGRTVSPVGAAPSRRTAVPAVGDIPGHRQPVGGLFGWAPLQIIAVDGLLRYGFQQAADRLTRQFVSLVVEDFDAHGTIVEKYDVRRRSSDLTQALRFEYTSIEIGLGWTNAPFWSSRRDTMSPQGGGAERPGPLKGCGR